MKNLPFNKEITVSPKQLYEYFSINDRIEKNLIEKQKKVTEGQIRQATKGKNIIISNNSVKCK